MEDRRILILNGLGGTPGVIRTPDPLLRRQVLYPAELRAHIVGGLATKIDADRSRSAPPRL